MSGMMEHTAEADAWDFIVEHSRPPHHFFDASVPDDMLAAEMDNAAWIMRGLYAVLADERAEGRRLRQAYRELYDAVVTGDGVDRELLRAEREFG